jgi:hypothetical protein
VGAGTGITVNADDVAVTTNGVTNALFRQSAALTVVGRASNSTGNVADIAATADDQIMRRTGSALDFGQLTVGMFPANAITYAKIQQVSATSRVLGRITTGAGNIEELTGTNLATIIGTSLGANPSASVGLTAVNGTAGTYMRSDAAPAIDQAIAPSWSGTHEFTLAPYLTVTAAQIAGVSGLAAAGTAAYMQTRFKIARAGGTPIMNFSFMNGTLASPTAALLGQSIGAMQFAAFDGSAMFNNGVTLVGSAAENWTPTSRGGYFEVQCNRIGTTTQNDVPFRCGSNATGGYIGTMDGAAAQPAHSFLSDADTGRYRIGANNMGDAVGGALLVDYSANRVAYSVPVRLPNSTVAGLVAAGTAGAGAFAFVTDATQTAILGLGLAVVGGGANKVPVYSDGTNWIII